MGRPDSTPPRGTVVAMLAIVAGVIALLGTGAAGDERAGTIFVTAPSAKNVVRGQLVRAAGQKVGSVRSIEPADHGRAVRLELAIEETAWPVPRGSKLALRWGGTVNYDNRYLALNRAPEGPPAIPDGGSLPARDFSVPVEFDDLLQTFTPKLRRDIRALLNRGGPAFARARRPLARALTTSPAAIREVRGVIRDLAASDTALDTLVRSTDSVVDSVHTADPGLGRLLAGAATTFDAVASEATAVQATLERAPRTLANARATLRRADPVLRDAGALVGRLAPGVRQLRRITTPLNSVLGTAIDVGPDARATLATARRATTDVNPLLRRAMTLVPKLGDIGEKSTRELKCIRPYTPDIIAFFTNWGDFLSSTDGKDKYIRATVQQFLPAMNNVSTGSSAEIAKAYPGLRYAFPRPPGYNAGQTWFLPECGAGPEALDPAKDPETRPFDQIMNIPPLRQAGPRGAR